MSETRPGGEISTMGFLGSLRNRLKIRVRLMLLTVTTVFFSVLTLSLLVNAQYQSLLVKKTRDVCQNLAVNLAAVAGDDLLLEDVYEKTRETLQAVRKSGADGLRGSYVVNQKKRSAAYGTIVAHTDESRVGQKIEDSEMAYLEGVQGGVDVQESADSLRFTFPLTIDLPDRSIRVGSAVFDFDREVVYRPIAMVRNSILVASSFLFLIAIGIAYFASRRLTSPIERLADAARQIADGKLGHTVELASGGEIAQLGRTFNHMSVSLRESERLRTEQAALKREMDIARNIQVAVLPPNEEGGIYSFHGFMLTADEVGGDYYDCIRVKSGSRQWHWFFIGDVSGHGLRSGLTMLMAQTAIHAALEVDGALDPVQMYSHVNSILYDKLRRLKENKYMTATFYRLDDKGSVSAAGMHQDALVYRSLGRKVETIPTDGFWLGIDRVVKGDLKLQKFKLAKGDILFSFTDGIVEAMNDQKVMFGQEKLTRIIEKNGSQALSAIQEEIMLQFRAHTGGMHPADDVTFCMIRRNR